MQQACADWTHARTNIFGFPSDLITIFNTIRASSTVLATIYPVPPIFGAFADNHERFEIPYFQKTKGTYWTTPHTISTTSCFILDISCWHATLQTKIRVQVCMLTPKIWFVLNGKMQTWFSTLSCDAYCCVVASGGRESLWEGGVWSSGEPHRFTLSQARGYQWLGTPGIRVSVTVGCLIVHISSGCFLRHCKAADVAVCTRRFGSMMMPKICLALGSAHNSWMCSQTIVILGGEVHPITTVLVNTPQALPVLASSCLDNCLICPLPHSPLSCRALLHLSSLLSLILRWVSRLPRAFLSQKKSSLCSPWQTHFRLVWKCDRTQSVFWQGVQDGWMAGLIWGEFFRGFGVIRTFIWRTGKRRKSLSTANKNANFHVVGGISPTLKSSNMPLKNGQPPSGRFVARSGPIFDHFATESVLSSWHLMCDAGNLQHHQFQSCTSFRSAPSSPNHQQQVRCCARSNHSLW